MISVPLDCMFVLDWNYLGFNTTEYINVCSIKCWDEIQFQQRTFVNNVAAKLYENSSLNFGANFYFYGDIDSDYCFLSTPQDGYSETYNNFNNTINTYTPSPDCPMNLCEYVICYLEISNNF